MKAMNRKNRSFLAALMVLILAGVFSSCRETPINNAVVQPGKRFVGEINGIVRNGVTGAPIDGVTLRLIGSDGNTITTTSKDGGLYLFPNLQQGFYKVGATAPTGFAGTRIPDISLVPSANDPLVTIRRIARDVVFYPTTAAVSGVATFVTPTGVIRPVPQGTPVFVDFTINLTNPTGNMNDPTATVGDVEIAVRVDSVRANGAITITGLPAVGGLARGGSPETGGEFPRLVVPAFTVDGVTYSNERGRAIEYGIQGLRPSTTVAISPNLLVATQSTSPIRTEILATNLNSRTDFGTNDSAVVVFNRPMFADRTTFTLDRTANPYNLVNTAIGSSTDGRLTSRALPAGVYLGQAVLANQAFSVRLSNPFVTGSTHRLSFSALPSDGSAAFSAPAADPRLQFTTVSGIRLLSVTASSGGTQVDLGRTIATEGLDTAGTIVLTFDRPPVGTYITRGPRRNVRFASGSANPGEGADERGRTGNNGEVNRIDSVGTIAGNTLTFGYRNLVRGTTYQLHASLVTAVNDAPVSNDASAENTAGNFRSAIAGDYGVSALGSSSTGVRAEFRSFRAFIPNTPVFNPLALAVRASNLNRRSDFRTVGDSIVIIFNKPVRDVTATLTRTRTPYAELPGEFTYAPSDITTTAVPAGTVLGIAGIQENQAYVVRLNRPYITGSDYRVTFNAIAADNASETYTNPSTDLSAREFTTISGLRLLSTSLDAPTGLSRLSGVAARGTVTINTAVPTGASVRPVVLRGRARNLELRTGEILDGGDLISGTFPVLVSDTGSAFVDSIASITTGGVITFNYGGLNVGSARDPFTGLPLGGVVHHIAPRGVTLGGIGNEVPLLASGDTANIRSTIPGDFGIGRSGGTAPSSFQRPFNLIRIFETASGSLAPLPIQVVSRPTTGQVTDQPIRIRFTRALTVGTGSSNQLRPADTLRTSDLANSRIRIYRTGPGFTVPGTASVTLPSSASASNDFFQEVSGVNGTGIPNELIGYRATLEQGGTELVIRRLNRSSVIGGGDLPFETGTTYTVELALPGLSLGGGTSIAASTGLPTSFVRFAVSTAKGITVASTNIGGTTQNLQNGQIVINFSQPLAAGVQFRTIGAGTNVALLDSTGLAAPGFTAANYEAIRRQATQGVPVGFGLNDNNGERRIGTTGNVRIDSVGTISEDRRSVTFNYFGLSNGRTYKFVAFKPTAGVDGALTSPTPEVFARDTTKTDFNQGVLVSTISSAIRSEIAGDYGIGGPFSFYRNRIDFSFGVNPPPAPPVFVTATSVTNDNRVSFPTDQGVTISFSRSMKRQGTFTIRQLTNPYVFTGVTPPVTVALSDLIWNGDSTQVTVRRPRYTQPDGTLSDSTQPFLAGCVYDVTASGLEAADGGALVGFLGLAFQTVPRTTVTAAVVTGGRLGTATRNLFTGNTANLAVADTNGTIRITFSRAPFGIYNTRGANEFLFALRDTNDRQSTTFDSDVNIGGFASNNAGGTITGGLSSSSTIDSTAVLDGNSLVFNYYVSRKVLRDKGVTFNGQPIDTLASRAANFVVQLIPASATASDASAPVFIRETEPTNVTAASTINPPSIRSNVPGDLGVVAVASTDTTNNRVSARNTASDRFDIKFGVTSESGAGGVVPGASFPEMVVSSVNNAASAISNTAKSAVSNVRSFFRKLAE
jgi:hypothetical protein